MKSENSTLNKLLNVETNVETVDKPFKQWLITSLLITLLLTGLVWVQYRATPVQTDPLAINAPMQVKRTLASSLVEEDIELKDLKNIQNSSQNSVIIRERVQEDNIHFFSDEETISDNEITEINKTPQQNKIQSLYNKEWKVELSYTITRLIDLTNALATVSAKHQVTPLIRELTNPLLALPANRNTTNPTGKKYVEAFKNPVVLHNITRALNHKFDSVVNFAAYMLFNIQPKEPFTHKALAKALHNEHARHTVVRAIWNILPREPSVRKELRKVAIFSKNPLDTQRLIARTLRAIEQKYGK